MIWEVDYVLMIDDYQAPRKTITVESPTRPEARTVAFETLLVQEAEWVKSGGDISIRDVRPQNDRGHS